MMTPVPLKVSFLCRLAPVTPEPSRDYLTSYAEREARERLQKRLTPRPSPTEVAVVETPAATVVLKAWVHTQPADTHAIPLPTLKSATLLAASTLCSWQRQGQCIHSSQDTKNNACAVVLHFAWTAQAVQEVNKQSCMIEACGELEPLRFSQCRHHASFMASLHIESGKEDDACAALAQFAQTEEAVREADKWSKIVEARLKEAQSKGQLSDELKAQSDEARRLEVEARNEAK